MIDLETLMLAAKMGGGGGGGTDYSVVKLEAVPNESFAFADIFLKNQHITTQELLSMVSDGKTVVADVNAGDFYIRCHVWQYDDDSLKFFSFAASPADGKMSIVTANVYDRPEGYAGATLEFISIEN